MAVSQQTLDKSTTAKSKGGSTSHLKALSDYRSASKTNSNFGYAVKFSTKEYHLVRNRNLWGHEDSI